jgi:hypothetical protein
MNLYNATPNFKVGWGIDYPVGSVIIDNDVWVMFNHGNQYTTHVKIARFRGADFEHTVQQEDGSIDVEKDVSTHFLGGLWYDASTGTLYAPIHCEYKRDITPPAGWSRKKTRLATSTDKGLTWKLQGDILTGCLPKDEDWLKFSGSYFEAGPADFDFFADTAGGYFYIFSSNASAPKNGTMNNFLWYNEVARCAIGDKMAPGTWKKFCNGTWTEPGLGGRSSRVSMDTYGIYGRVIYSTYLKQYCRIGPCLGVGDKRYTDLGFTDGSIYISTCADLSRQQWSPKVKVFEDRANDKLGITVLDGRMRDPFVCDSTLHIYNYWLYKLPSRAIDVTFGRGATPAALFPRWGSYAYEPLPESGDTIVARKTRIVGCTSSENLYSGGTWTVKNGPNYYRTEIQQSGAPGSSIQFTFTGADIYWRAVADSDGGRADVFIDGTLAETVDCYYERSLPFQFAFIRKGLDPNTEHTIRIVVRSDHNPLSHGSMIDHMAFEYAAESYSASAGFSSVSGKNQWLYQQDVNGRCSDVAFHYSDTIHEGDPKAGREKYLYPNYWGAKDTCVIGQNYQTPGVAGAVRTFIAPHDGIIRIEGTIAVERDSADAYTASIRVNNTAPLLTAAVTRAKPVTVDRRVSVKTGDAVHCIVHAKETITGIPILWDPTMTYIR